MTDEPDIWLNLSLKAKILSESTTSIWSTVEGEMR